jgi:hypothetical protein
MYLLRYCTCTRFCARSEYDQNHSGLKNSHKNKKKKNPKATDIPNNFTPIEDVAVEQNQLRSDIHQIGAQLEVAMGEMKLAHKGNTNTKPFRKSKKGDNQIVKSKNQDVVFDPEVRKAHEEAALSAYLASHQSVRSEIRDISSNLDSMMSSIRSYK